MSEHVDTPMHGKTLTVAGLIKELQTFPQHWPVITEGCDCLGSAFRAVSDSSGETMFVLIEREPAPAWPGEERLKSGDMI